MEWTEWNLLFSLVELLRPAKNPQHLEAKKTLR